MQVVTDVEARANNTVIEALSSVLESEVKTQNIVKSAVIATGKLQRYLAEQTRRLTNCNPIV
jgi:predicted ATP-grasp superfamily ATP-dependent carboligase